MSALRYSLVFFVILAGVLTLQFSYPSTNNKTDAWVKSASEDLKAETHKLYLLADQFKLGKISAEELQQQLSATRLSYKKLEFLLEYYFPGYVEEHINGAPLLHIERYDTRPFVLPPEGLQVLDEQIFAEKPEEEKVLISQLALDVDNHTEHILNGLSQERLQPADIVEAMREELIRVFSMGLTGFDTPGSLNALVEAQTSLGALAEVLPTICDTKDCKELNAIFQEAVTHLAKNNDFETFDRLHFLRTYINPLYAGLGAVKSNWTVGAMAVKTSRNLEASSIFSEDFLDPYFFAELKKEEDTKALKALGERLFYDPILSGDGKMSCASCHNPAKGFTDGQAKSLSNVVGHTVQRNAPSLLNAVYADRYFYDLRAFTLEQQVEHVIFNTKEFNTAYAEILEKLNSDKSYKQEIKQALGTKKIDREGLSAALASYVLSLQSFNSDLDKYARGESDQIKEEVKLGFNLFMGKANCGTCHFAPTFSGLVPPRYGKNESEILGVLTNPIGFGRNLDSDMGRVENGIYSEQAWIYERSFKTTSVRNVELTGPYFHNGAYKTLEQVVDFYNNGGGQGIGLEVKNQTLPPDSLNLTEAEKAALVLFMKSLTDNTAGENSSGNQGLEASRNLN